MMNTTSTRRKMNKLNQKRALIRIQKELQYIASKATVGEKDIRKAIYHVVSAILSE